MRPACWNATATTAVQATTTTAETNASNGRRRVATGLSRTVGEPGDAGALGADTDVIETLPSDIGPVAGDASETSNPTSTTSTGT